MNKYQLLYIIDRDVAVEDKDALIAKFQGVIEELGGTVSMTDKWGMKKFAYLINHKDEGYYVHVHFDADPSVPAELDRQMRINDSIIRQMITLR